MDQEAEPPCFGDIYSSADVPSCISIGVMQNPQGLLSHSCAELIPMACTMSRIDRRQVSVVKCEIFLSRRDFNAQQLYHADGDQLTQRDTTEMIGCLGMALRGAFALTHWRHGHSFEPILRSPVPEVCRRVVWFHFGVTHH